MSMRRSCVPVSGGAAVLVLLAAMLVPVSGRAQNYFSFRSNTEDSYAIVVQSAVVNGIPLSRGDEIGVFTPAGLCVGATVVPPGGQVLFAAWQDDPFTPEIDGFVGGEVMQFRVWHVAGQSELVMDPTYLAGNGTFGFGPYALVTLSLEVNFAPRLTLAASYSFDEDTILELPLNDHVTDANHEDQALTWTISAGQNITAAIQPGNLARFVPAPDWFGSENLTFVVQDPAGASDTAVVRLHVLSVNDLPKLQLPPTFTLAEDDTTRVLNLDNYVTDVESPANLMQWQITADPNLNVAYNAQNRSVRLRPKRDYFGPAQLRFTVTDPDAGATTATLAVTITPVPDPPSVAVLQSPVGGARVDTINVVLRWQASTDPDGDALTYLVLYGTLPTLTSQVDSARTTATTHTIPPDFLKPGRKYYWRVQTYDGYFPPVPSVTDSFLTRSSTGVEQQAELPRAFALEQNYPNPVSLNVDAAEVTFIRFSLPQPAQVELTLHNTLGQKIRELVAVAMPAGRHQVSWDGRDAGGRTVTSGIYWLKLRAGQYHATRRVLVIR